jgi:hypothetical protein
MKYKTHVFLALAALVCTQAYTQGTFIYDQQSSDENNYQEGGADIQQNQPVGQSFTPSLSTVGFIRLFIYNGLLLDTSPADIAVSLRSSSITGPLLGVSATVLIPGGSLFGGPVDFVFSNPVNVTPSETYYFQPVVLNNNNLGLSRSLLYNYPNGTAFLKGSADSASDLWFREGIIVPEPSVATLLFGTGVWLIGRRRRT